MCGKDGRNSGDWRPSRSRAAQITGLLCVVGVVVLTGLLVSTVAWPPLIFVETETLEPNIQEGDLVLVVDEKLSPGDDAHGDTGVVTAKAAADSGYTSFDAPGDVIVYAPDGDDQTTPIIHRAAFWVERGENWYDEADTEFVGAADNCDQLANCPAPHGGFITRGDDPDTARLYDQAIGISTPVRPSWIQGRAEVRVL